MRRSPRPQKFDQRRAAKLVKMVPEDGMNPRLRTLVAVGLLLASACALGGCYYYAPPPAYYYGYGYYPYYYGYAPYYYGAPVYAAPY